MAATTPLSDGEILLMEIGEFLAGGYLDEMDRLERQGHDITIAETLARAKYRGVMRAVYEALGDRMRFD